jgi:hypothetical protein
MAYSYTSSNPSQGNYVNPNSSIAPITSFGSPSNYTAAANTQASDYDTIMQNYAALGNQYRNNPIAPTQISPINISPVSVAPTTTPYTQSADVTKSIGALADLTNTGGYSAADIANIRARDISPIRSIYSNAMQNLNQQRALQGGYSPGFDATQAQMARDEANQIANTTTSVNAGIAQNVAANELAAASPYASASADANAAQTAANQANTNIVNQINESNAAANQSAQGANQGVNLSAQGANQQAKFNADLTNRQGQSQALSGQSSLYGTNPALTSTFGNQVMQAVGSNQNQQSLNQQNLRTLLAY